LLNAVDGFDFVFIGGRELLGEGDFVAGDDAKGGGGGGVIAVEKALVDGEKEGEDAEGHGGAGEGKEGAAAIAQQIAEDEGEETKHERITPCG
jgi:hypothetical protein